MHSQNRTMVSLCKPTTVTAGCSSARLEYASGGRVVAGSNPVTPTGKEADSRMFLNPLLFVIYIFVVQILRVGCRGIRFVLFLMNVLVCNHVLLGACLYEECRRSEVFVCFECCCVVSGGFIGSSDYSGFFRQVFVNIFYFFSILCDAKSQKYFNQMGFGFAFLEPFSYSRVGVMACSLAMRLMFRTA